MGPTALFDKSFLQSLSVDESVWFANFFIPVVCPVFYTETLADLEKPARPGQSAESEVASIAEKFPEATGTPNYGHSVLVLNDLLGQEVAMTGQIIVPGGQPVSSKGQAGVAFHVSEEADAFQRWQQGDFKGIERDIAKKWRDMLKQVDLAVYSTLLPGLRKSAKDCRSLGDVRALAAAYGWRRDLASEGLNLLLALNPTNDRVVERIAERFQRLGRPALRTFAPYASHVLEVEIFLMAALQRGFVGTSPSSNRIDFAYLYYLPFSMVFISQDRLHRRCAPYFLRENQRFVWGPDLKAGLREIDQHYKALPEVERDKGILAIAAWPPTDEKFVVPTLWDQLMPGWREKAAKPIKTAASGKDIAAEIAVMQSGEGPGPAERPDPGKEPDYVIMERRVRKKRGSWYQVPKDMKE